MTVVIEYADSADVTIFPCRRKKTARGKYIVQESYVFMKVRLSNNSNLKKEKPVPLIKSGPIVR